MAGYGLDAHWNFALSNGRFYDAAQDGIMSEKFLVPRQVGRPVLPL